ncbi:MAG TPA: hypothetical protein VHY79_13455, partial [Rhizomicrobium sp.]|nr:hypothetical protein [Rhizomicrobium sp.]
IHGAIAKDGLEGGLVGTNDGKIVGSYARGTITSQAKQGGGLLGSLVAWNDDGGAIANSYARSKVTKGGTSGGLVGQNDGAISASYCTGEVTATTYAGGLIGFDQAQAGSLNDTYWDTETSGITNPSQGAGNIANDPGITGLSTAQLQSGLPAGFDPTVWGENTNINNGLPYLLANPPT